MNTSNLFKNLKIILNATEDKIKSLLLNNYHILVADKDKSGNNALKYDFFINDNLFFACNLSNSSHKKIILTAESITIFSDEYFHILWETYISLKDVILVDYNQLLNSVKIDLNQYTIDELTKELASKDILLFNVKDKIIE